MAADGYFYSGTCYATLADYSSAFFSAQPVRHWVEGTQYVYLQSHIFHTGAWKRQTLRYDYPGTGSPISTTLVGVSAPGVQACDLAESFLDGMTLGWAIAAACVAVYSIKFLWKAK